MQYNNNTFKVTICDLKNKNSNMADNIEHQDKGELVANCDRFYSHRLKASCATNGYFYKLYAPLRQIVRKLRTISNCFFLFLGTTIVVSQISARAMAQQITKAPSMPTSMPMWYIRKFTECKLQWFSTLCIRERICWL